MKRILCLILAAAILFSLSTAAIAAETEEELYDYGISDFISDEYLYREEETAVDIESDDEVISFSDAESLSEAVLSYSEAPESEPAFDAESEPAFDAEALLEAEQLVETDESHVEVLTDTEIVGTVEDGYEPALEGKNPDSYNDMEVTSSTTEFEFLEPDFVEELDEIRAKLTLTEAVSAFINGTGEGTYVVMESETIFDSLTIPTGFELKVYESGILTIGAGVVLSIEGMLSVIDQGVASIRNEGTIILQENALCSIPEGRFFGNPPVFPQTITEQALKPYEESSLIPEVAEESACGETPITVPEYVDSQQESVEESAVSVQFGFEEEYSTYIALYEQFGAYADLSALPYDVQQKIKAFVDGEKEDPVAEVFADAEEEPPIPVLESAEPLQEPAKEPAASTQLTFEEEYSTYIALYEQFGAYADLSALPYDVQQEVKAYVDGKNADADKETVSEEKQNGLFTNSSADTTPPVVTGIVIEPAVVDAPGYVTVTVSTEDDLSEVNVCTVWFRDPDTGIAIVDDARYLPNGDGTLTYRVNIPETTIPGNYVVQRVYVCDDAGNDKAYYGMGYVYYNFTSDKLPESCNTASFTVYNSNPVDSGPPVITGITVDPAEVTAPGSLTVTVSTEDDMSGTAECSIHFYCQDTFDSLSRTLTSNGDGTFTGTINVPETADQGNYIVSSVHVSDVAGFQALYLGHGSSDYDSQPNKLPESCSSAAIFVNNPISVDVTPPVVTGITFEPAVVDAPGTVTVTITAEDDLTTVVSCNAWFRNTDTGITIGNIMDYSSNGDGSFSYTYSISEAANPGSYVIQSVNIKDVAGNQIYYYGMGKEDYDAMTSKLPESCNSAAIVVNSSNPVDSTPPVVTGIVVEPAEVVAPGSVTVTIMTEDDLSGPDYCSVWFCDPNTGVSIGDGTPYRKNGDGSFTLTISIPESKEPGKYIVDSVIVIDAAGNLISYDGKGSVNYDSHPHKLPESCNSAAFKVIDGGPVTPKGIEISGNVFPDPNFRSFIKSYYDEDKDGFLTDAEIAAVTDMSFQNLNVESMEGVGVFTSLEKLNCQRNYITSLDLTGCTALKFLNCSYNPPLDSLNVKNCLLLQELKCTGNCLSSLDVSGLSNLTSIECPQNRLTNLNVKNCAALTELNCNLNQLTELDLSGCTLLQHLECRDNQLTNLDVSGNKTINRIQCYDNQLANLNIDGCTSLNGLECYDNLLQSIDISTCPLLLDVYHNYSSFSDNNGWVSYWSFYGFLHVDASTEIIIPVPPEIITQPSDATVAVGGTVQFTIKVSVPSEKTVTYQWQYKTTGRSWTNSTGTGNQTDTLSFIAETTFNGTRYRCMVTDGTTTLYSNVATLTVTGNDPVDTIPPVVTDVILSANTVAAPGSFDVIVNAVDEASGIKCCSVLFRNTDTNDEFAYDVWPDSNGKWKVTIDVPEDKSPGDYIIDTVSVTDGANNTAYYYGEGNEYFSNSETKLPEECRARAITVIKAEPVIYGWQKLNNNWYYYDENGEIETGWAKINNKWYFFNDSGEMQTGWIQSGGKWYYLNSSGSMATGWVQVSGKWYYMAGSGAMQTGWQQLDGKWYYFSPSGAMQTGWQEIGGKWYYFAGGGSMVTGWQQINGKWYYFAGGGSMVTGWQQINGKWYYFEASGSMVTGWQKINNKWYYFGPGGAMATGWLKLSGNWYYLNSDGSMVTGSKLINGKTYSFNSSGVCLNP